MSSEKRDYSETLFLPQTDFPMRAGLPQREAPEATMTAVTEFIARVHQNEMAGVKPAIAS